MPKLSYYKKPLFIYLLILWGSTMTIGQGKSAFPEKTIDINNPQNKTLIRIVMPPDYPQSKGRKTLLVFYALPNGNSIEWTMGKQMSKDDDWHFDIQQIAAQTRYLRELIKNRDLVLVYLTNQQKSWPAWKKQQPGAPAEIKRIVDSISGMFAATKPEIVLDSHSGGGSFIFGYLDAVKSIPASIQRIAFIDSDYGYEDSLYTSKLINWLRESRKHALYVLAYNDSVVIYNGKPLVSATGGTWYRSQLLQRKLGVAFSFQKKEDTAFIQYHALHKNVAILLKTNPGGVIYHTEQVARNGFIHTIIGGTRYEKKAGYLYWGPRVYTPFIDGY